MKKRSLSSILLLVVFVLFSQFGFSEVKFLSPIAGEWGNKQMLVIENMDDGEYYYSVDGSDPEQVGFAYDGPVLLDIAGDVPLKVTHISPDGSKDFGEVQYSVVTNIGFKKPYEEFLFTFLPNGYYDYNILGTVEIPESLTFTLEDNPENFIPGMSLSIADDNVLTQFVPCTLYDKDENVKWRFFIKTEPEKAGIFTKRELPFEISDWTDLTFTSDDFIYRIDSEYWGQPEEDDVIVLDRSVPHTISWQSVSYVVGNSIESVVLPPKPELKYESREDGSGYFHLVGDESYALSLISDNKYFTAVNEENPELFCKIGVDVFYGDRAGGELTLGIYSDAIYQGQVDVSYEIDKLPPERPVITASAKTFYSRNSVDIDIGIDGAGEDDGELFVAVCDPFIIENPNIVYNCNSPIFNNVIVPDFNICENNAFNSTFKAEDDKVVYYKVLAYCQKGNMKSPIVEYSVIVDKSSYYFDKDAENSLGEGTLLNPFTSIDQCIEEFKDIRSVSLCLKGDLYIDKKIELNSNIQITNGEDGRIIFGPEGTIEFGGSSLEISDCRLHKIPSADVTLLVPFFRLNEGTLKLKDCEISGDFSKNGTIIDCLNSIINVENTIASISADSYGSFISGIDSKISIIDSSISITGDTGVIISASGGDVNMNHNKFSLTGNIGRIAELFGVNGRLENNEFRADFVNKSKSVSPIFASKKTKLITNGNSEIGF